MSITTPFEDARAVLGLGEADEEEAAIKRAYRRAVVQHPPDTDPDGFRRVRDAYELLRDPWSRAEDLLLRPLPEVPPPAAPAAPPAPPRGTTAVALLRLAAMNADPEAWTAPAPGRPRRPSPRRPKGTT
jgi:curved DNA-binding protein CbpA